MAKAFTKEFVIKQFNDVHKGEYDYSLINYKNDETKIVILCKIHGKFKQSPSSHKKGSGCPLCGRKKIGLSQINSKEKFVEKVNKIHPNSFSFEKTIYQGAHKKLIVTCLKCKKDKKTSPVNLYYIEGCNCCTKRKPKLRIQDIIIRFNKIHDEKYDYSLIKKTNSSRSLIKIICPHHGVFKQQIDTHLYKKSGCPKCKGSRGESRILRILNDKNIKYYYQYRVKINNSYHYFDFYIPENNLIIEFNGIQHYNSIGFFGGDNALNIIQKRDKIKQKYCLDNKIEMLNIKYNEFKQIEEILNKYL